MRDSMVMYRSFSEAIEKLSDEDAGKIYKAVTKYAMDDVEPELEGALEGYFLLMKPQIDANNKRYANGVKGAEFGKLGGRPKKPQENPTETPKKPQENPDQTPNENENVNENVNVRDKKRTQKHKYGNYSKVMLTDDEYIKLKNEYGEDKVMAAIQFLDEYIAEKDYKSKSHYLAIRRWVISALDERKIKKTDNRLGVFGDYKQTSSDSEWDELTDLAFREVNR